MFIVSKVNGNKILLFWKFCSHSFHCRSNTRAWLCWKKGWSRRICWGFHTPRSRLGRAGLLYPGCVTSSMFLMSPSAYVCFYRFQLLTKVLIYLRRKNAGKANWRRLRFLKTWLCLFSDIWGLTVSFSKTGESDKKSGLQVNYKLATKYNLHYMRFQALPTTSRRRNMMRILTRK